MKQFYVIIMSFINECFSTFSSIVVVICATVILYKLIDSIKEVALKSFEKTISGGAKSFGLLFERGLKFFVVLISIFSITILGFYNIIDSQGIIGVISSIVAYTLGTLSTNKKNNSDTNNDFDDKVRKI